MLWPARVGGTGHRCAEVKLIVIINVKRINFEAGVRHDFLGEQRCEKAIKENAGGKGGKGGEGGQREGGPETGGQRAEGKGHVMRWSHFWMSSYLLCSN